MGTGTLACDAADCTFDTSGCSNGICGNNTIEGSEQCDGPNLNNMTCELLNWGTGNLTCTNNCTFDPNSCSGGTCGNGTINYAEGEDCDGANLDGTSCQDWGFSTGGNLACNSTCRMDFSACTYMGSHPQPELIAAGGAHSCGASSTGVFCWGWNQHGQLGTGSGRLYLPVPTTVYYQGTTVLGASSISAGGMHTCAVATNSGLTDKILCWGNNNSGQLGVTVPSISPVPVVVSGARTYTAVAAGFEHTCAIAIDKTVWCWGSNFQGQLGDGTINLTSQPVQAMGLTNIVELSAGFNHTCAIEMITSANKKVWCWGANDAGQIGNGTKTNQHAPLLIQSNIRTVACGENHTCALDSSNTPWCWGSNAEGQLAMPVGVAESTAPNQDTSGMMFLTLTAGSHHNCASQSTGQIVYCWGRNSHGQLGLGDTTQRNTPSPFTASYNVLQISGGGEHTCARETDGSNTWTYCWGGNWYGQLGSGTNYDIFWEEIVF